jgi:opacity protein-like surface antigen
MKKLLKKLLIFLTIYKACLSSLSARALFSPYVGGDFKMEVSKDDSEEFALGSAGIRVGTDIGEYFGTEIRLGEGIISNIKEFSPNVELELGINYYVAALGKIQTPIYHGFRAYALGGVARVNLEITTKVSGIHIIKRFGETDFAWGVGTNYFFNKKWALNLEYLTLNSKIQGINSGISYHF